jgi:hypothetical protein
MDLVMEIGVVRIRRGSNSETQFETVYLVGVLFSWQIQASRKCSANTDMGQDYEGSMNW